MTDADPLPQLNRRNWDYLGAMPYHTVSMPPALQAWVDACIAEGAYADAVDHLRDLVRRDQEHGHRHWRKAMIDEGLKSGVLDQDAEDVLDEIIAKDPDLRG